MKRAYLIFTVLAAFMASCSQENVNNTTKESNEQGKLIFSGSMTTKPQSRTSFNGTFPGTAGLNNVTFYWEVGDNIWLDNDSHAAADITAKNTDANFDFSHSGIGGASREVYYPGTNATKYNEVTIAASQTQTEPNSTAHIGESGDCGTATATRISPYHYEFTLNHKVAYLCLLPRTPDGLTSTYISQIKITSDNDIAGTYTLASTGLTLKSGGTKTITLTTKSSVYPDGFPLNNAATHQATNAAYVVIAPGTHALTIEYTFKDNITDVEGTMTKTIASAAYAENTVYPLTANINLNGYPGNGYYSWDAQQNYWAGYEWNSADPQQPTVNFVQCANTSILPMNSTDPRISNPIQGYNDPTGSAPAVTATNSAKDYPNVNELLWYAKEGKPHWDNTTPFALFGHLYTGGMWFKKKAGISSYNPSVSPDGTDYTRSMSNANFTNNNIETGKPSNADDYFYLPAAGFYDTGTFFQLRIGGWYWSSSPRPKLVFGLGGYILEFHSNSVKVIPTGTREMACLMWTAQ